MSFDQLDELLDQLRGALAPDGIPRVNDEPEHVWQVLDRLEQTLGEESSRELLIQRGFPEDRVDAAFAQLGARRRALDT